MLGKRLLVGVGSMLVGAVLVVVGLIQIPVIAKVLILLGGTVGFVGYRIYEQRGKDKPDGMIYG